MRIQACHGTRPKGDRVPVKKDVVNLNDEHGQPIELLSVKAGKWWWAFDHMEENEKVWNGPFKSRKAAIADAEAYCG